MKYLVLAVLFVLLVSSAFAQLTEERRACVRACCDQYGGTYLVKNNGCENASEGAFECGMACADEPQPEACPIAILPAVLAGAALMMRRR